MKNLNKIDKGVCAAKGFLAGGIYAGIRKNPNKKDLALIYSTSLCDAAAVYTQNKTKAAPLQITHQHMQGKKAQAIICNSGNANACTPNGNKTAEEMCALVAAKLKIAAEHVLVASTGVIGEPLNVGPIRSGVQPLVAALSSNGSNAAANAILTTDTAKKEIAVSFTTTNGTEIAIGGICKGSGMIHPNMATMLGFITTDAAIDQMLLQKALSKITADTFNMVSVDGDTSTNDMVLLLANGQAGNTKISATSSEDYEAFYLALKKVCLYLAVSIAKDGEGATKLLECCVNGAASQNDAKILAKSVITSTLFKAAMFGEDANWGRIICALGYAPAQFDPMGAAICFSSQAGSIDVCENGFALSFDEALAKKVLAESKIIINIKLKDGKAGATAWGCDLSYDYVKINGDYRS